MSVLSLLPILLLFIAFQKLLVEGIATVRTEGLTMRIAVSNDHAGFPLKSTVLDIVRRSVTRSWTSAPSSDAPVDFPIMTQRVTDLVRNGDADRGLLVCGTGVGASIAANKFPGIRAAVIHDTYVARQGVEHDDVNVGCLGCLDRRTPHRGGRHHGVPQRPVQTDPEDVRRRVAQLADMECPTPMLGQRDSVTVKRARHQNTDRPPTALRGRWATPPPH